MFTVCPKCALTLVVTAADLRVAQGYVRCGRCSNVFNAIAGLSEDRAAAKPPPPPPPPPPPEPEPEPEPVTEAISAREEEEPIEEVELEFNPASTDVSEIFIEPVPPRGEASGTFESIVLEADDTAAQEDAQEDEALSPPADADEPEQPLASQPEPEPEDELDVELRQLAERLASADGAPPGDLQAANDEHIEKPRNVAAPREVLQAAAAVREADEDAVVLEEETPVPVSRKVRIAWSAGTVLMALLLLVQIVHHYRNDLAVHPRLNGPLTALYSGLGLTLNPRWDVAGYEVRQLGAETDPGPSGRLTVRASLKNAADQPQPMPLLRVTVQDRFGNRIAASDVAPSDYLPSAIPATSLLGVGQRIDAEMAFVDPGREAVGFEIDACLPAEGGYVQCANDALRR